MTVLLEGTSLPKGLPTKLGVFEHVDHVADAFTRRSLLVELNYAHHRFVVEIDNAEASDPMLAAYIADRRATHAFWDGAELFSGTQETITMGRVGDLARFRVFRDTAETRELLGVAGPPEEPIMFENLRAA